MRVVDREHGWVQCASIKNLTTAILRQDCTLLNTLLMCVMHFPHAC